MAVTLPMTFKCGSHSVGEATVLAACAQATELTLEAGRKPYIYVIDLSCYVISPATVSQFQSLRSLSVSIPSFRGEEQVWQRMGLDLELPR